MKKGQLTLAIATMLVFLSSLLGLGSCANVGSPEGGPFDVTPPRLLKASPSPKATEVREQSFRLRFDEFVKLSGQEKVIVSPPQKTPPRISAIGREVTIQLEDSLRPNTTYSFYFDDAIVDNNEDNPLENFEYTISTGKSVDSMQIGGLVLDAQSLEPIGGVVIGAYPSGGFADSLFQKTIYPFASKTNKMGSFVVRGLKDDSYRVFALKDADNDYRFSLPSEGIAFTHQSYRTSKLDSIKTDTIRIDSIVRRDTLHRDSLVTHNHTYYYPDNVLLRYFEPETKRLGLDKTQRTDSALLSISFLSEQTHFPALRLLTKTERAKPYFSSFDSPTELRLWLRDTALMYADSLKFEIKYQKTDSLFDVKDQVDTLTFYKARQTKLTIPQAKSGDKKEKKKPSLAIGISRAKGIEAETPQDSLILLLSQPVDSLPLSVLHLTGTTDSVYKPVDFRLHRDSLNRLRYYLDFPHPYNSKYKLKIDSASIRSIYGLECDSVVFSYNILPEADFGGLSVRLEGIDSLAVVELLDKSDKVLTSQLAFAPQLKTKQGEKKEEPKPSQDPMLESLLQKQKTSATNNAKKVKGKTKEIEPTPAQPADSVAIAPALPSSAPSDSSARKTIPTLEVVFKDLKPGEYYLRLFVDANRDGRWTTGEYPIREPEMVYYAPQTFSIKKGFTSQETWKVLDLPLEKQKPEALRKTKPEEKKKREDKNAEYYKRIGKK